MDFIKNNRNLSRETNRLVNEKIYRKLKREINNNNIEYERKCGFVRELQFDYSDGFRSEDRIHFSIVMSRHNNNELYLTMKRILNGVTLNSSIRLTNEELNSVLQQDTEELAVSNKEMLNQLALQMKYNKCYPFRINEYFQEIYINKKSNDKIEFKTMYITLKNNIKEFLNDNLSPLEDIDYDRIQVIYSQNINVPNIVKA